MRAGPAHDVADPIQVVARFGQEHEGRFPLVAPVAAHEGVRLVPEPHRLQMLDAGDLAQPAGVHDGLDLFGVCGIAQHVADGEHRVARLRRGDDLPALRRGGRHGLLQQDVVAARDKGQRGAGVQRIGGGDDDRIGETGPVGGLPPVGEDVGRGDVVPGDQRRAVRFPRLGHAHDLRLVGAPGRVFGVVGPAAPRAEDQKLDGWHTTTLLSWKLVRVKRPEDSTNRPDCRKAIGPGAGYRLGGRV